MTIARRRQVCLSETPYYHCIARCVRRAFLCGEDRYSGKNLDHRKQWLVDKIKELAEVFAMDICAYAVMSNHYHLVIHVDMQLAESWSDEVVIDRWCRLFGGHLLVERLRSGEARSAAEQIAARAIITTWRERLADISWFMRCLNQFIAYQANKEDNCKGRFWEGRFKSQALLDERALLTCMSYVDLNPVRAGMASTPEQSEFTSIYERIQAVMSAASTQEITPNGLLAFAGNSHQANPKGIPFKLIDYLQLVDWTGRAIRDDTRGAIPQVLAMILTRLNIDPVDWHERVSKFGRRRRTAIGSYAKRQSYSAAIGKAWVWGG
jgi:putative transposase